MIIEYKAFATLLLIWVILSFFVYLFKDEGSGSYLFGFLYLAITVMLFFSGIVAIWM
jgi:uncharacterized membrane protein